MGDSEMTNEPMKFESILQVNVPKGRDGKHKEIITQLLSDIARLDPGAALKIPLARASRYEAEHPVCSEPGCEPEKDRSGDVEQRRVSVRVEDGLSGQIRGNQLIEGRAC